MIRLLPTPVGRWREAPEGHLGRWIGSLFVIAIAGMLFFHFFGASWSNRCDPGNARYELLAGDGVVDFAPDGRLLTWINPGPDNLWLCSDANLSVNHLGPRIGDIYEQTRTDMTRNGWSEIAPGTSADFSVYEKVKDGLTLTAVVRKELFWVEVALSDEGGSATQP